jgi:hypothetical protein
MVTDYFIITASGRNGSRMTGEGADRWICELDGGMYVSVLTDGLIERSKQK